MRKPSKYENTEKNIAHKTGNKKIYNKVTSISKMKTVKKA